MSYYFMAGISIRDEEEYKRYLEGAGEVFARYGGEYLAVDNNPQLLEGRWESERAVLIRFNSKEAFDDWYQSDDYQAILKHRLKASESNSILIRGKE